MARDAIDRETELQDFNHLHMDYIEPDHYPREPQRMVNVLHYQESGQEEPIYDEIERRHHPGCHMYRGISLFSGFAIILNYMVGCGIFLSPQKVLEHSGSAGVSLLVWVVCGLISFLVGLCYAELGTMIPRAGGDFIYLLKGLGPLHEFWGPLLAFLCAWMRILVIEPCALAIQSLAFAEMVAHMMAGGADSCSQALTLFKCSLAVLLIWLAVAINSYSTCFSTGVNNLLALVKLLVFVVLLVAGNWVALTRSSTAGNLGFGDRIPSAGGLSAALYHGLWAYDGWNKLNFMTEEMENPTRDLPRAIIISTAVVTVCYTTANAVYLGVLSPDRFLSSTSVVEDFAVETMGAASLLISGGVLLAILGNVNVTVLTGGRIPYAVARERHLMQLLAMVQSRSLTPMPALALNAALASSVIMFGTLESLVRLFGFTQWTLHALVVIALLVMRRTQSQALRPFRVPLAVPWLVLAVSILLIALPLSLNLDIAYMLVVGFLILGVFVYIPLVYHGWSLRCMPTVTVFVQKLLLLQHCD